LYLTAIQVLEDFGRGEFPGFLSLVAGLNCMDQFFSYFEMFTITFMTLSFLTMSTQTLRYLLEN